MYATYSPDDNKLRLYPSTRLDAETYAKVKAAGFKWAPKQELFVAPAWSPAKEDLLVQLCGEIDDEDTTLTERAEVRSERFEVYSEKRGEEAERAYAAVSAIADNIPLGQPILVGHHSEKHARRDADKITTGMRKAVKAFKTSEYWADRAKGAISHAKYKELPQVRARRIKGLETDQRREENDILECEKYQAILPMLTSNEQALDVFGRCVVYSLGTLWNELRGEKMDYKEAVAEGLKRLQALWNYSHRWLAHISNRLIYERAMLDAQGGIATDRKGPEKGGGCKCWASHRGGYSYIVKVNKVSVTVLDNWGNGGKNFTRTIPFDQLSGILTAAEVETARTEGRLVEFSDATGFCLTDAPISTTTYKSHEPTKFDALEDALRGKTPVQVVVSDQLFPTPAHIVDRMIEEADISNGDLVLEPSAGTGAILDALKSQSVACAVLGAEINRELANNLRDRGYHILHADFLECHVFDFRGNLFDKVLMNPPFAGGADIKHIKHAYTLLKPGGKLVAICANGPRQKATLEPICTMWEPLPAGTFSESGTNVNTVMLAMVKEAA